MDGRPSLLTKGGQNPAYRSAHYPPSFLEKYLVLHLPYRELPVDEPGAPDTRSPLRFLMWLAGHQKGLLFFNALFGIGWMVSQPCSGPPSEPRSITASPGTMKPNSFIGWASSWPWDSFKPCAAHCDTSSR